MGIKQRICALTLSVVLLGALAACGKKEAPAPSASPSADAAGTPSPTATPAPTPTPTPAPTSPVTGEAWQGAYKPIAIMVENHPDARPQSGLSKADVVYEAYAEGSISRFMAVFTTQFPQKVGPVRSARVYFVNLAREWDPIYMHFGGAQPKENAEANVYNLFKKVNFRQRIDGMNNTTYIQRDNSRKAPHNAYANLEAVAAQDDAGTDKLHAFAFRSAGDAVQGADAPAVTINYEKSNVVHYTYDAASGKYNRTIGSTPFTDKETGQQVQVRNIIVQHTTQSNYPNAGLLLNIKTTGEGKATYFMGGKTFEGTWKCAGGGEPTKFYDASGNEVQLLPGNTWIQVLSGAAELSLQ
nr:DUF3048 domain-containing protein [Maliibacterium massiliense]